MNAAETVGGPSSVRHFCLYRHPQLPSLTWLPDNPPEEEQQQGTQHEQPSPHRHVPPHKACHPSTETGRPPGATLSLHLCKRDSKRGHSSNHHSLFF